MIKYDRFFQTIKEKEITQYALYTKYGLSRSLLSKLKRNESITAHTMNMLCEILNCRLEDIAEYVPESNETEEDSLSQLVT